MRTIAVVTGARSDYGIYLPILKLIRDDPDLRLRLMVCGMHLAPVYGHTVKVIEDDGFAICDRIETLLASDTPESLGKSMGLGLIGFSEAFAREKPDILLVLGDRYEMFAAATAALPFAIPIAHIHGGELTAGAIDDSFRHALTKMSHLHFVATETYRRRVIQLGEQPDRVWVSGAPGIDTLMGIEPLTDTELGAKVGMRLDRPPLLVTFHPVTQQYQDTDDHIAALLGALASRPEPIIITYPNADTYGQRIVEAVKRFAADRANVHVLPNLGSRGYVVLLRKAVAMIGNSSSGIIEAASFCLPVVNIGDRQRGRECAENVIHCGYGRDAIAVAIDEACSEAFRKSLDGLTNPYGDGQAAGRIVAAIKGCDLGKLAMKEFHDLP